MYDNYYEEDEINLIDLCIYIIKRWKNILLVSLCVALAIAGAYYVKDDVLADKSEKSIELEIAERKLDYLNEYEEKSIYFHLNPYNVYCSTAILEIYDVKPSFYSNASSEEYEDNISIRTGNVINKYITKFNSTNLDGLIENVEDRYIKELIGVTNGGSYIIIKAKNSDKDIAANLAQSALDIIASNYDEVKTAIGHKIRRLDVTTTVITDNELVTTKDNFYKDLKETEKNLDKLDGGNLVKYSAIGFIGGAFIACAYYAVKFLFGGYYLSSKSLEESTGIKCLGTMCTLKDKNKLFNKLSGERVFESKEKALTYIKNSFKLEDKETGKVLLTSSLSLKNEEVEDIVSTLGETTVFVSDYLHNPEVIEKLKNIKNVILIEKKEVSSINTVKKIKQQLEALNIKLIGFIEL